MNLERWAFMLLLPWAVLPVDKDKLAATYNGQPVFYCEIGGRQDCLWVREFVDLMNERRRQEDVEVNIPADQELASSIGKRPYSKPCESSGPSGCQQ